MVAEPTIVEETSRIARAHEQRDALGALAFDVVSRQGQAQTLFAGRDFVEARSAEHGVDREAADTEAGNLLTVLERGPQTDRERALVSAFAVEGLRGRLEHADEEGRDPILRRFVSHADWLTVSSPYVLYPFALRQLPEAHCTALWQAVADAVIAEEEPSPAARARNAARLTVLADAMTDGSRAALEGVAERAGDPATVALARSFVGEEAPAPPSESGPGQLSGRIGHAPSTSVREALRIVFGIAALEWLGRGLGNLIGLRREGELELVDGAVRVRRSVRLLGRRIRESEETYALSAVAGVGRAVRYPALHLLVGLLGLAMGVLLGGLWLFEGIASGETVLLLVGAAAVLLGAGFDLALTVLVPGRRGQVAVDFRTLSGRGLRLLHVAIPDADQFLDSMSRRLRR